MTKKLTWNENPDKTIIGLGAGRLAPVRYILRPVDAKFPAAGYTVVKRYEPPAPLYEYDIDGRTSVETPEIYTRAAAQARCAKDYSVISAGRRLEWLYAAGAYERPETEDNEEALLVKYALDSATGNEYQIFSAQHSPSVSEQEAATQCYYCLVKVTPEGLEQTLTQCYSTVATCEKLAETARRPVKAHTSPAQVINGD